MPDEFTFAGEPAVVEPDQPDVAVEPLDIAPRTFDLVTALPPEDALADDALSMTADPVIEAPEPEPEPQPEPEPEPVAIEPVIDEYDDDEAEAVYYDPPDPIEGVRIALDDNNDALRTLSEAMYELASNVRMLVDEVERLSGRDPLAPTAAPDRVGGAAGDVTATAMLTLTAELGSVLEKLSDDVTGTRNDLQSMMDDMVAAASGSAGGSASGIARLSVDLDRVQSELQALKRRLPVRAKEIDAQEIADHVAELVLDVLSKGVLVREPVFDDEEIIPPPREAPAPRPSPRPARPVRAEPVRAEPVRAERPVKATPVKKAASRRARPLRPE